MTAFTRTARLKKLCGSAMIGLAGGSCAITVNTADDDEEIARPSLEECAAQLEHVGEPDAQRAFEDALAEFEARGVMLEEVWNDPEQYLSLYAETQRRAGCEPSTESFDSLHHGLHREGAENYCGPGHGAWLPEVAPCVNDTCRTHDACYASCSRPTSLTCMWGGPTEQCDRDMLDAADACDWSGHWFSSFFVVLVAKGLAATRLTAALCPDDMTCPGAGPCRTDPDGTECSDCLSSRDVAGACLLRACEGILDEVCYLANCDEIGGCFGGYGLSSDPTTPEPGMGGAGGEAGTVGSGGASGHGPATGGVPGNEGGATGIAGEGGGGGSPVPGEWELYVVAATVPPTKPSGELWDAEGAFEAPDPFVRVRVGNVSGEVFETTSPEDVYDPSWPADVPLLTARREDLAALVSFEVWDEDLSEHDIVGACTTQLDPSMQADVVQRFECADVDGLVLFTVEYLLRAVP